MLTTMRAASNRSITRFLTSSAKVALSLNWRRASGSVLSMSVRKDRLEFAVASHPELDEEVIPLPSIPMRYKVSADKKVLSKETVHEIEDLVQTYNAVGLVVSWPVQKEGWCGAPAGRVLHTLDQISEQAPDLLQNKPICLWDSDHRRVPEDEWGRTPVYAVTSDKTEHRASKEQYEVDSGVATEVWNDFVRSHWPELYQPAASRHARVNIDVDYDWIDSMSSGTGQKVALL